jgi:hypothetical protein
MASSLGFSSRIPRSTSGSGMKSEAYGVAAYMGAARGPRRGGSGGDKQQMGTRRVGGVASVQPLTSTRPQPLLSNLRLPPLSRLLALTPVAELLDTHHVQFLVQILRALLDRHSYCHLAAHLYFDYCYITWSNAARWTSRTGHPRLSSISKLEGCKSLQCSTDRPLSTYLACLHLSLGWQRFYTYQALPALAVRSV